MSSIADRRRFKVEDGDKLLEPVRASAAIGDRYQRMMMQLIKAMHRQTLTKIRAQFGATTPELTELVETIMAQDEKFKMAPAWSVPTNFTGVVHGFATGAKDRRTYALYINGDVVRGAGTSGTQARRFASIASAEKALEEELSDRTPADDLNDAVRHMRERWEAKFEKAAERMAEHFAEEADDRVTGNLKRILRDSGFAFKRKLSGPESDVLNSIVNENVSLIKSIPERYFTQIEGMVQRSVQRGGDLSSLTKDLMNEFGVTKRRAGLIAHDQNRKANASLQRTRQMQMGIKQAIWVHSHAGKKPRKTHKANDGKKYDVVKGWWDPDVQKYIQPGELINCRCFSRAIIPGFS